VWAVVEQIRSSLNLPEKVTMPQSRSIPYRPDLDGLRAVAVLLVVGHHAFPGRVPGGFIGVDIFFVISGYLISSIIVADIRDNRFTFTDFYYRRCRRIIPALATVLLGTWLLGAGVLLDTEFYSLAKHILAGSTFTSNFLLWQEAGYFDTASQHKPLLHLWSLGVEEQFYIFWPLLLLLLIKVTARPGRWIASLIILSFSIDLITIDTDPSAAFYLLPGRFWELMVGAAIAVGHGGKVTADATRERAGACMDLIAERRNSVRFSLLALSALTVIVASALFIDRTFRYPSWSTLLPVVCTAILILVPPVNVTSSWILASPVAIGLGLISYPLYLWHWPLLSFASIISDSSPFSVNELRSVRAILVLVAMGLAYVTWRFIEKPIQRNSRIPSQSRGRYRCFSPYGAALIGTIALGVVVLATDGMPFRYAVIDEARASLLKQELNSSFREYGESFPRCTGEFAAVNGLSWCYQESNRSPEVAMFGDSHADALFYGFSKATEKEVMLIGRSGCPPFKGVEVSDIGYHDECVEVNDHVIAMLAGSPAISDVILVARGPLNVTGEGFGHGDEHHRVLRLTDESHKQSLKQQDIFVEGYRRSISAFLEAGKRVVFVIDFPELGYHPAGCVYARPFSFGGIKEDCFVEKARVQQRQKEYVEAVQGLVKEFPELLVFDAMVPLCDEKGCYGMRDGHILYYDGHHIGRYGSELVGAALSKFLEISIPYPIN
jgi:peptidoglycan/LPS O-acetylase OafA/YrhL